MQNLTLPAALAAVLIGACAPKPSTSAGDLPQVPPAEASVRQGGVAYGPVAVTVKGLYRSFRDKGLFVACDTEDDARYEVIRTAELDERYRKTIQQGYEGQSVVATITGRPEVMPTESDGNGEPPPMPRFLLESIGSMEAKNPRNTCRPYTFWALGNEPFWNLQISRDEALAEWSALGENTVGYEYAEPLVERDGKVTRYVFPGQQRMKVTLVKEECVDNMAGNRYPYSVTVERAGKTYKGCAHDYLGGS